MGTKEDQQKHAAEQAARREAAKKGPIAEMWVGSIVVSDGVVLQGNASSLIAFDADTGEQLWEVPKGWIHHLWYTWQENYVIDGVVWTWGKTVSRELPQTHGRQKRVTLPETLNGYDIKTGERRKSIDTKSLFLVGHHHRCYRGKATERFVIASHRGVEMIDVDDGSLHVDRWVRATCHIGFMPANGLLYSPPHPCRCFLEEKLSYMNALAAESAAPESVLEPDAPERLKRGKAYGYQGAIAKATDWPAFRHDSKRSGSTPATSTVLSRSPGRNRSDACPPPPRQRKDYCSSATERKRRHGAQAGHGRGRMAVSHGRPGRLPPNLPQRHRDLRRKRRARLLPEGRNRRVGVAVPGRTHDAADVFPGQVRVGQPGARFRDHQGRHRLLHGWPFILHGRWNPTLRTRRGNRRSQEA